MIFLYNLIIHSYQFFIKVFSLFNPKAKQWVQGRKGIFGKIKKEVKTDKPLVWFHCASLGEFEQGRPVIEAFKNEFPEYRILLTFFSPSGYEVRKNYKLADYVFYLPADTSKNARKFLALTKPSIAFFVKYEYWFNYIRILKKSGIPIVGVASIFRPGQRFFTRLGRWQLNWLKCFKHFFVQNETSQKLLNDAGISQVTISGDTRFDRVFEIAGKARPFPLVEKFKGSSKILIAGSTWPPDEELLVELIQKRPQGLKIIIAPHEVHKDRVDSMMKKLPGSSIRFSEITEQNIADAQVLVIDNIGILSNLYQYAELALIGGGFGVGIHNILEAATFGMPVVFGPIYKKFQEACELIDRKGAYPVNGKDEFIHLVSGFLDNDDHLLASAKICKNYVDERRGATDIVMKYSRKLLK